MTETNVVSQIMLLMTATELRNAGIPRRRHGYNLTSDTREEIACVRHKIVAVFGESVSVSVSASWNAALVHRTCKKIAATLVADV